MSAITTVIAVLPETTVNVPRYLTSCHLIVSMMTDNKNFDRYAPPTQPVVTKRPVFGTPDLDEASTSFCERTNLSVRVRIDR